jgi:hypothetical protein
LEKAAVGEVLFLTLTAPGRADLTWNDEAGRRFGEVIRLLRKVFKGATLEYHRVGETHRGGLIHYHVILRGLRFLPHGLLVRVAERAGFGRVCWVARPDVRRGGIKGWVLYSGKYLVKGVFEWELPQHVCTHSRGWSLDWLARRARSGEWEFVRCEAEAYAYLVRGEGVRGSLAREDARVDPSEATLTPGHPP